MAKIILTKKELKQFKDSCNNCGGPEHNAYYELQDKIQVFIEKLENKVNKGSINGKS